MPVNFRIATSTRNTMLNALRDSIDATGGAGTINIYTGTQPINANTALSGNTLLGTLTFSSISAPVASGGVLTFSSITDDSSTDASGVATFARILTSAGNVVFDCDVAVSLGTINLNTVSIASGGILRITSFTVTASAA